MSFRLRVLALVSLVAVTAVVATAYLAFTQVERQVTESAAADRKTVTQVIDALAGYARQHGTWENVSATVRDLSARTGQRIKLVTEAGLVVVDTDTLAGRTARAVVEPPTLVDPRPRLALPTTLAGVKPWDAALAAIGRYRSGVLLAACMTRLDLAVVASAGEYGVPDYAVAGDLINAAEGAVQQCLTDSRSVPTGEDRTRVTACRFGVGSPPPPRGQAVPLAVAVACLERVFTERTADVAPVPLRLYIGATGELGPSLAPGPVIGVAGLVALLAVAGTIMISRRVLRPIGTLTAASRRLGEGDLGLRVPVAGRDELAELARSFNRMADSLQRGEERQRRLVADVAHELRTPLANLRGYLEALKDGVLPANPELFASLHEEAVLQQRIVDDLQDLALAEAGALAYHRTQVDLAELLETCRVAQQAGADAAGVALRVCAPEPVIVQADPDRLRQVVGNLVTNALRATPAGGSVTLSAAGPTGGWATVVVRDTGVGIAAADLPYVFDRFWRADTARGRSTGGSGLGLAIARQIITDHGGRISVESRQDAGTAVDIAFPAP